MAFRLGKPMHSHPNRLLPTQPGTSSGNRKKRDHEVEAYTNPTELFRWINFCRWDKVAKRAKAAPSEAAVWIVRRGADQTLKWKYLPIHLVCLQPNPPRAVMKALLDAYPEAVQCKDNDGNLPIHYACTEGVDDIDVLKMLIKADPNTLLTKDHSGRIPLQILHNPVDTKKISAHTRESMIEIILWQQQQVRTVRHEYEETREPPDEYFRRHETKGSKGSKGSKKLSSTNETRQISIDQQSIENKYESKITELEAKIEMMELKDKERIEVTRDLEIELKKKGIAMEESETRIRSLEDLVKSVTYENERIVEQKNKTQSEVVEIEVIKKTSSEEKMRLERNVTLLEDQLAQIKAEYATMEGKYQELKEAEMKERQTMSSVDARLKKLESENSTLQSEIEELEETITKTRRKHEREIFDLNDENGSIRRKLEDKILTLTNENKSKEQEIKLNSDALKEISSLREQVQSLREENHKYERQIEDQKNDFDSTMIRIQTALSKQASAFSFLQGGPDDESSDSEYEGFTTSNPISTTTLLDTQKEISDAQAQISQLTLEKHDLRAETLSLTNKNSLLENEVNILSSKLEHAQEEVISKNSMIKEIRQTHEVTLQTNMKQFQTKEEELLDQIEILESKINRLSEMENIHLDKDDNEKEYMQQLEDENVTLQNQVETLQQKIMEKSEQIRQLTEERKNESISLNNNFDHYQEERNVFAYKDLTNARVISLMDSKSASGGVSEEEYEKLEQSNKDLKKKMDDLTTQNQSLKRKLNFLTANTDVRDKLYGYELNEKVSKLADAMTEISSTQSTLIENTVKREKQFQDSASADRERLIQTISRQEKEMELAARKREQVMKALVKQEEELQIAAAIEREKIVALAAENGEDIFLSAETERESISKVINDLQKEIQAMQIEIGFFE